MDMSQVQFAPTVWDDIRLAQKMLIGGDWVSAISGRTLPVYDPADGRMIVEVPDGDAADVDRAVAAARAASAYFAEPTVYFAEPTVLVNAKPDSRIMHEEIFGPVVCAVPFDTEDEVLALANNTRFGLGAAVWTRDISRAHRMAAAIESGQVWVNCYQAADSALPFGGTKESGWGRETCRETLEEYLETKTVVVSL
jgi:phenylacetaldehyde dehydrogenase